MDPYRSSHVQRSIGKFCVPNVWPFHLDQVVSPREFDTFPILYSVHSQHSHIKPFTVSRCFYVPLQSLTTPLQRHGFRAFSSDHACDMPTFHDFDLSIHLLPQVCVDHICLNRPSDGWGWPCYLWRLLLHETGVFFDPLWCGSGCRQGGCQLLCWHDYALMSVSLRLSSRIA